MDKGLLVIAAIGAAIIYFAMHFSDDSGNGNELGWEVRSREKPYEKYYEKDALGDDVLNVTSLSLSQAKSLWPTTPTSKIIAKALPDFGLARTLVGNHVKNGAFKTFLYDYLEKLEGRFLVGEINSDQAKKALINLK
jgi:hypothetical protein